MDSLQLIERIKNLAARHVVQCVEHYNRNDRDDGPFMNLTTAKSGLGLLDDFSIEHRFFDLFVSDLQDLLPYKANRHGDTVIFDAIVESHVLPMSGIEVMERALGLHESRYERTDASDMGEQETPSITQLI